MLKFKFDVKKSNNREANESTISIWNLKESSRTILQEKGLEVILKAGYIDGISQIVRSDIERTNITHPAVDWIVELELADGAAAMKSRRINKSFRGPQQPGAILKQAAEALGLDPGNLNEQIRTNGARSVLKEWLSGNVLSGKASDVLDEIASSMGLNYSVQDKKLQFLPKNGALSTPAIKVSLETGMVGSPQIGEDGTITVKSLLDPRMVPGQKIDVESLVVSGDFVVANVHHFGDTWGPEWTTEVEAKVQ
jgi:hypothetical protein